MKGIVGGCLSAAVWLVAAIGLAAPAAAAVEVNIALSQQRMTVDVDGRTVATWAVSTARPGYATPQGSFRPYRLEVMHHSSLYEWTPMPYSIFFDGNYAIHGTGAVGSLGHPVSHGCVRLAPGNARTLFQLVRAHGAGNTVIHIGY